MLVAFSVTPLGAGEGVGEIVAEAVRVVRESGLPNQTDAMFTTIEGDWDETMAVVKRAVDAVAARAPRVSLVLKADLRPGVTDALTPRSRPSNGTCDRMADQGELRTGRLLLRHWHPADRVPFAAMNADPEVTTPASREPGPDVGLVGDGQLGEGAAERRVAGGDQTGGLEPGVRGRTPRPRRRRR